MCLSEAIGSAALPDMDSQAVSVAVLSVRTAPFVLSPFSHRRSDQIRVHAKRQKCPGKIWAAPSMGWARTGRRREGQVTASCREEHGGYAHKNRGRTMSRILDSPYDLQTSLHILILRAGPPFKLQSAKQPQTCTSLTSGQGSPLYIQSSLHRPCE